VIAGQQLLGLIVAVLSANPPVAGGAIKRQAARPVAADLAQAVNVRIVSSRSEATNVGSFAPLQWLTVIAIECVARGVNVAPDEAVGAVIEVVHNRIAGDTAALAAGFDRLPEYRIEWDQEELDDRIGAAALLYTYRHQTTATTLNT
jgi:hypothetical protein